MAAFCVGVTGGVASGKSEVTRRFEALGVVVADADLAARAAVAPGSDGLAEVAAAFGPQVLDAEGGMDRAAMRRLVFNDAAARKRLEAIVHPRVRAMLQAQCTRAPGAYAIAAIPLLAEGGREAYPWLERVLVVDVPVAVQQARVMQRDRIDAELAARMIAAQATREARLAIADDILVNDGSLDALQVQVEALDRRYRAMAAAAG
ncbi:dephospho-CoA kinase [Lysobacter enzymogenes]|uniref:Dephospho-CoA kinase n=1 Tax=Lysobacter enzymogenes TaxID=69 RepID=A0A3N2RJ38_LYSEN|nr:dephospho-CoA kinase [Lysobacter enzymogenes]ROU07495.1 dephospho-CoA kinase [Lysobacter enzymogenes]